MVHINTTNLSRAILDCEFFQAGYTCTIDYGTDSSYANLDYRDTFHTQGKVATIILSWRLRGGTIYYYIVTALSSSHCVRVRGRFQVGRYKYLCVIFQLRNSGLTFCH